VKTGWKLAAGFCLCVVPLNGLDVILHGRVVDENATPVAGARITLQPGAWQTESGPTGAFTLVLPEPGEYVIHASREGYYELKGQSISAETLREITLVLNTVREVFQEVNVEDRPSLADLTQTHAEQRLSGTQVNEIPYPASHSLRNALRLMPGAVQDSTGAVHFNGSSEEQILYLLNGFNITDPITGGFRTRLGMEGVHSLQYSSGRYSPEFGKGSAGALAIQPTRGTDQFHYTATNFVPGLDMQQGVRLGDWYPRFGASGPLARGRAWFADNFGAEYNQSLVSGLPKGGNIRRGWAASNLLHTHINLTPSNILLADFLVNLDRQRRIGLGPLDPPSTTTNLRAHQYFASIKNQLYLGHGALLEGGYARNVVCRRLLPQCQDLLLMTPAGRRGNHYAHSMQSAIRDQVMVDAYLPAFRFAGTHQIKTGVDANRLSYTGDFRRTGYAVTGLSGLLLSKTVFGAPAHFQLPDTEMSSYVFDSWRFSKRLQIGLGVRHDWDRQLRAHAWSPRVSASWAPFTSSRTRISAGYAVTHDAVNFNLLGRPLDQAAYTIRYEPDGTPAGPPVVTRFTRGADPLHLPRAVNWSAGLDHQVRERLLVSFNYLRRRGTRGFTFVNISDGMAVDPGPRLTETLLAGVYQLTNFRHDDYDKLEVTAHHSFASQYEWMASYTFSRAYTNSVLNLYEAQPLQITPARQPLPWDAPHRFVGWAYFPLPWRNWAAAVLVDARSGFPFSVQDETGRIVGGVNSYRYPLNFVLNLHLERTFNLIGYRFAVRGGVNNVTNRANPTAVNNTIGAPGFLEFRGAEGRHFVTRIRFFGRATKSRS